METYEPSSGLWPTPRVCCNRTSKKAMGKGSSSAPSLEQAVELASGIMPREIETLEGLPPSWAAAASHSFRAVPRANLPALQANVRALVTSVGCGVSGCVLYARLTPFGWWQRTPEGCFPLMEVEPSEPSSVTWPKWGTAWDGVCTELPTLALRIEGKGSSLLPTPIVPNGGRSIRAIKLTGERTIYSDKGKKMQLDLGNYVKMYPTMTARDGRTLKGARDRKRDGGKSLVQTQLDEVHTEGSLNPDWVSRMMGYPDGWLDVGPMEAGSAESPESPQES